MKTAGSKFATFILVMLSIFRASPMMRMLPIPVISAITELVSTLFKNTDPMVIAPWYTSTLTDEIITPMPKEEEKIIAETPSSMDFAKSVL